MFQIAVALFVLLIELFFIELTTSLRQRQKAKIELFIVFFQLFILAGWRDLSILNDTSSYAKHFQSLNVSTYFYKIKLSDRFEPGYLFFEKFFHNIISSSILHYDIITSFIILSATFLFFHKYSRNVWLTLFLYVTMGLYFSQVAILRQSLALVFGYIAFNKLLQRKYLLYVLMVLIAYTFHSSAFFLLFYPIALNIKLKKKNILLLLLSFVILFFFYGIFIDYLSSDSIYSRISEKKDYFSLIGLFNSFSYLVILLIIWFARYRVKQISEIDKRFILFCFISFLLSVLSIRLYVLSRFDIYLAPFSIILLPNLIKDIRKLHVRYFCVFLVLFYFSFRFFFLLILRPDWFNVIPYKFY